MRGVLDFFCGRGFREMLLCGCGRGLVWGLFDAYESQFVAIDRELDFVTCEGETVDAVGVVLVMRSRVFGENFKQGALLVGFYFIQNFGCGCHVNLVADDRIGEASFGVGDGVGVGEVRLDVYNRGAVHQVGSAHDNCRVFLVELDFLDFDAGERYGVRTEAGACREYA